MKNVDRLARYITKNGAESIMIHTIPGTSNWIICQKIELGKWALTLCDPMGNVTYTLGTVSDDQHLQLWSEITKMAIEKKASQIMQSKQLTDKINNFKKNYANNYRKFIKRKASTKSASLKRNNH